MPRPVISPSTLSLALVLAACGDNVVGGEGMDGGLEDAAAQAGYPSGPFGVDEGQVLQNLSFAGYVVGSPGEGSAVSGSYREAVSLQDLRELGSYRFMLLNVAAEWCVPCQEEAQILPSKFTRWAERGGLVAVVLTEDARFRTATKDDLDRWGTRYQSNHPMLHDPERAILGSLAPSTMPLNLMLDIQTMRILRRRVGNDPTFFDYFEEQLGR